MVAFFLNRKIFSLQKHCCPVKSD